MDESSMVCIGMANQMVIDYDEQRKTNGCTMRGIDPKDRSIRDICSVVRVDSGEISLHAPEIGMTMIVNKSTAELLFQCLRVVLYADQVLGSDWKMVEGD